MDMVPELFFKGAEAAVAFQAPIARELFFLAVQTPQRWILRARAFQWLFTLSDFSTAQCDQLVFPPFSLFADLFLYG